MNPAFLSIDFVSNAFAERADAVHFEGGPSTRRCCLFIVGIQRASQRSVKVLLVPCLESPSASNSDSDSRKCHHASFSVALVMF